jgi:hypothetical protein
MEVNDQVRFRNVKSPVGGAAVATLELSTTLNGSLTDSVTTITLTDGSQFPTSGFIVIEKVLTSTDTSDPLLVGTYQSLSTASSHSNGAKVYGSYKVTALTTVSELAGYNDSDGNPAYVTKQTGIKFNFSSAATSTETGGGVQCTIGPVNDRG